MTEQLPYLPYGRHSIDEEDVLAVAKVLRGEALTAGPAVESFERALADRLGIGNVVALSSGTAALHLLAMALQMKHDEAVIVPAITFTATASAFRLAGACIVFADVDSETGLITPETLYQAVLSAQRENLTPRIVLPVYLGGQGIPAAELAVKAGGFGLSIIEDACHALGSADTTGGKAVPVGASPHVLASVFSFHPVKAIAMGEGGAVATQDAKLAQRLRRLRSHGIVREPSSFALKEEAYDSRGSANPWYYEVEECGLNYRVPDILCALGQSQLSKLDRFLERRQTLAGRYDLKLKSLAPLLRPVPRVAGIKSAWHLYSVLIDFATLGMERATLMNRLRDSGIGSQVHYIPLPWHPAWRTLEDPAKHWPGAAAYYARCLSLPIYPGLEDAEQDRVIDALLRLCKI